jgi:non-specific serine/threonine protein kinase
MPVQTSDSSPQPGGNAVRWFGRLQLLRLMGKSELTMAWRVADPRSSQELMLVLPRVQPANPQALDHWQQAVRKASRLNHPQLAAIVDIGVQDGWPFVTYDPMDSATLAERASKQGLPSAEAAELAVQTLSGLAFAHEAGVAHHDLQPYMVLLSDSGQLRVAGMAVAAERALQQSLDGGSATDSVTLRVQREAAERDVLSVGVLLHGLLAGGNVIEEGDIGRVIQRLPPLGREVVRLPFATAHPIAEPLRAIVNRSTDRQERQRYRNARTLLRALEGWLQTDASTESGALALLADKLRVAGALPSSPGASASAARLARMDRGRTNDLAEVVLQDLALSFEMLRLVNTAQARAAQLSGSGPVLAVRRAIAMLGLDGVRRAALALRPWPGPLNEAGAQELSGLIEQCKRAARLALALRPAGYDGEVVYLITLLQNLGRLVVQYHFAEDALQIRRLMQPGPPPREGEPEDPGLSEEGACFAVLGADVEAIGAAVARHWGLDDSVLAMVRRIPPSAPVHAVDSDGELLRMVASCANDAIDLMRLSQPRQLGALQKLVQRYGRLLHFNLRDIQGMLQESLHARSTPITAASSEPSDTAGAADVSPPPPGRAAPVAAAAPGNLRRSATSRAADGAPT